MSTRGTLPRFIEVLKSRHGPPKRPEPSDPLQLILWENVAYLVDDRCRAAAWAALRHEIGDDPQAILDTHPEHLARVIADGGMHPARRADKLRRVAEIATDEWQGDIGQALRLPLAKAKRALRRFPGIGEPGAEKIILFARAHPIFTVESNGLRVLLRLGYASEGTNYGATYRAVQEAVAGEVVEDFDWLIEAHQLLRLHGQAVCRRTKPQCQQCPLVPLCPSAIVA